MDENNEKISALIDGELPDHHVRILTRDVPEDGDMLRKYKHYHLISDTLRNHLPTQVCCDLSQRISLALDSEPSHNVSMMRRLGYSRWVRPVTGFALAASIAAMAYLGVQGPSPTPELMQTAADTDPPAPAASSPTTQVASAKKNNPAIESKINDYLLSHNEVASSVQFRQNILPHVRIVSYERAKE